jgi:hypothetical protein
MESLLIENPLNESSLAFPLLECFHIAGFVCGVGTAALVSLRLLGVGLIENTASKLWSEVMPWTLGGLSLAIFSGLLLFSIDPDLYLKNDAFRFKMLCLVLAIVFYYTAVRKTALGSSRSRGPVVGYISLGLWVLVPLGGIFIEFIDSLNISKI